MLASPTIIRTLQGSGVADGFHTKADDHAPLIQDAVQDRRCEAPMVKDTAVPKDVQTALSAYPHVQRVWEACPEDLKETWLNYIEEAGNPAHRERRIDIMIAGLRP